MMIKNKKATLNDVALRSGVSYQTVSRVINNHPSVAEATRKRVLQVIAELDYRPNRAARSLVTRRSQTVGIISYGIEYFGPAQMVMNIEAAVRRRGYGLALTTIEELSLPELSRAISDLVSQNVDGIVMITPIASIDLKVIIALCAATPVVMVDIDPSERIPSVAIDQRHGAQLATQHLIDLGHRHLCEISGPLNWYDARLRHEGWLATLKESGLAPGLSFEGDWTAAGGYAAMRQLLDKGKEFSAVFVGNDQMALGAIRALREAGLRVPHDVSIVGFDDVPEAAYFDPPLTTVKQDFRALGQQSIEYLMRLIGRATTSPNQCVLYPHLVVRLSTMSVLG
jgi:LacI family transcriptional regulator